MGDVRHDAGAVSRPEEGPGLDAFRGMDTQTVLTPADLKTGNVIYPYEKAK